VPTSLFKKKWWARRERAFAYPTKLTCLACRLAVRRQSGEDKIDSSWSSEGPGLSTHCAIILGVKKPHHRRAGVTSPPAARQAPKTRRMQRLPAMTPADGLVIRSIWATQTCQLSCIGDLDHLVQLESPT